MTPTTQGQSPAPTGLSPHFKNTRFDCTPAEKLLDLLHGVRRTGPQKWQARCPSHDDRSPSLSIRETSEGTLLLKCWAGCSAHEIVSSVGLKLSDLFPRSVEPCRGSAPRFSARELLETAIFETTVVALAYRSLQSGNALSPIEQGRVEVALMAIDNLREVASGNH